MREESIVGGSIFKEIKSDERVTQDLAYCLYCRISHTKPDGDKFSHKDINYKIPLDSLTGDYIKQCPACKTIYILKDPIE